MSWLLKSSAVVGFAANSGGNVVIVNDESLVKKPRDVASSRSGEMVAKPSEKVAAAAAVTECVFCRP
jgi:hypothetical protein